jgi:hypothetical protein
LCTQELEIKVLNEIVQTVQCFILSYGFGWMCFPSLKTVYFFNREESEGKMKGILGYTDEDLVSSDFIGDCR